MTRRMLSEAEGYALLKKEGLPVPEFFVVRTRDEAAKAADDIGYPLVMKVISAQISHKSDAGGVIANISSSDDAKKAFDVISHNVNSFDPSAVIDGIIIEQQKKNGLEILVGGKIDPTFGKVLTIGMGGTLVELIRDVSLRILPVSPEDIDAMIQELKGYPLIKGFRNNPPADKKGLIDLIETVSRFFMNSPDVVEFDLNPVFLYEKGLCVVDARIYVSDDNIQIRRSQKALLSPDIFKAKSIAVVGASPEPNKVGYAVLRNLLTFPGKVYPVNLNHDKILGRDVWRSLAAIPDTVDIAVVVVPARFVPQIVREAGEKRIPLVIIISSGFRETGKAGSDLESQIIAIAEQYSIRIMGPNCLGIMLPHQGINTTFDPVSPRAGSIAFISQSGAIISTIVDWSLPEEIGFSAVISIG
ncbi:MAG: acetate--CoA ligase family protein, partial [Methanoregula sp.]|nr:acetate--CoA ligase family protein [Methanoregula sp.]